MFDRAHTNDADLSVAVHQLHGISQPTHPRAPRAQCNPALKPSLPRKTIAMIMIRTLFLDLGSEAMNDVFLIISEAPNGKRSAQCVLAGDEDQARHAYLEHYPDEQIVTVRVPLRTPL